MYNKQTVYTLDVIGGRFRLPPSLPRLLALLLLAVSLLLVFTFVIAKPYIPQSESKVLDYLPTKLTLLSGNISKLKSRVGGQHAEQQEKLIKAYLEQAKSSGDMRYVSYAQNRLDHWLQQTPGAEKARLLNAQILQYNHNFDHAIVELKSLLNDYPENSVAWSLLANLQLLTGNFDAAQTSCKQLSARSSLTDAIICQSNIMIRTGLLDKAYRILNALLPVIYKMPVQRQLWLYTSLAEISIQQGHNQQAGRYIEQAIELTEENNIFDDYLSRLHIDYLIQNNRLKQAYELVKDNKNDSALMIRSTVLAKKLGNDETFHKNKIALTRLFEVEKRRGQSRHLREQALFALLVLNNPAEALYLAKQNWVLQKEPEDARILMKAALLVDDNKQLQQVKTSIKKTGLIDQRLDITRLRESLI